MKIFKSISVKENTFKAVECLTETLLEGTKLSKAQVVEYLVKGSINNAKEDINKKYNFVPSAPKGFMHRWIRARLHKLTTAGNWTLVRADQYPDSEYPVVDSGKYAGVIGVGGLLLARMSKEIVKPKRIKDVKNENK